MSLPSPLIALGEQEVEEEEDFEFIITFIL
jgi:hypothetical protein